MKEKKRGKRRGKEGNFIVKSNFGEKDQQSLHKLDIEREGEKGWERKITYVGRKFFIVKSNFGEKDQQRLHEVVVVRMEQRLHLQLKSFTKIQKKKSKEKKERQKENERARNSMK
jgi:hypothetical protein